jgi:hypothetical protein
METTTKYTQKTLHDKAQGVAPSSEIKMMWQAICALIKTKCGVYIPDNSTVVSEILKDCHTQLDTVSDLKQTLEAYIPLGLQDLAGGKGINVHRHNNNKHLTVFSVLLC